MQFKKPTNLLDYPLYTSLTMYSFTKVFSHVSTQTISSSITYIVYHATVESAWQLLMPWCIFGTGTSATIILTQRLLNLYRSCSLHYNDVIMGMITSQITSLTIVYSTVYSGADQRKHQSSVSLAFVWGIHQRLVNSVHKWPVMQKMFPFDDIIMCNGWCS